MKIAIFTDTYLPNSGGVVRSLVNSTNLLTLKNHEVLIFAPSAKGYRDQPQENVKVYRFSSIPLPTYKCFRIAFPSIIKTIKILRTEDPDIIHVFDPATVGIVGIICGKLLRLPVAGTFHTLFTETLTYISPYRLLGIDKLLTYYQTKVINQDNIVDLKKDTQRKLGQIAKRINKFADIDIIKDSKVKYGNSDTEGLHKKIIWKIINWVYNKCILVTAPSESIIEELKKKGVKSKIIYLSNGIDIDKFAFKKEYRKNSYKILHIGRLGFEKNVEVIIKAMPSILGVFPNAKLTIVGSGPALLSLVILTKKLKLNDNVVFSGYIPNNELPDMIRDHDIFVTASTMETQGLVILESMSCGLPVVGVDKYAIPDLVKNGVNGYVTKPFDSDKIAEYVTKLLKNREHIKEYGMNSARIAKEHALEIVNEELENAYKLAIYMYENNY
jgi:glycosyltransferase involved in cell wall biosynthesis